MLQSPSIVTASGWLALVFAVLFAVAPAKAQPVEFVPTGGWVADFAEDSCSLVRSFAHGDDTISLRLQQYAPGNYFQITLASSTLKPERPRSIPFSATATPQKIDYYETFRTPDGLSGVMFEAVLLDPPAEGPNDFAVYDRAATIDRLTVDNIFGSKLSVMTGSLRQPLKVMEGCLDDLLKGWGIDGQAHRTLNRRAEPTWQERWISVTAPMQRDFRQQKNSGRQDVRLIVDERGKVSACRVLNWPENDPIARRMCNALLENAEMPPALDSSNQPIKSYFMLKLTAVARTDIR